MQCEECQQPLWKAGEIVPAGTYARIDDRSYRVVRLDQEGPLPATLDGHIAWYSATARACACMKRANLPLATAGGYKQRMEAEDVPTPLSGEGGAVR